jgi:hypothetical protein
MKDDAAMMKVKLCFQPCEGAAAADVTRLLEMKETVQRTCGASVPDGSNAAVSHRCHIRLFGDDVLVCVEVCVLTSPRGNPVSFSLCKSKPTQGVQPLPRPRLRLRLAQRPSPG